MLQAMNTGHDGSLSTVHANSPRDAMARLETLVLMAGMDLPLRAIREQIASAVDVIVQITRLRDGTRRVTHVTEVQGMEGDIVTLQDAFSSTTPPAWTPTAGSSASRSRPASGRGSPTGSTSWASQLSPAVFGAQPGTAQPREDPVNRHSPVFCAWRPHRPVPAGARRRSCSPPSGLPRAADCRSTRARARQSPRGWRGDPGPAHAGGRAWTKVWQARPAGARGRPGAGRAGHRHRPTSSCCWLLTGALAACRGSAWAMSGGSSR